MGCRAKNARQSFLFLRQNLYAHPAANALARGFPGALRAHPTLGKQAYKKKQDMHCVGAQTRICGAGAEGREKRAGMRP